MAYRQPYPEDYATHIPVLIGIARLGFPIRNILEFGSGRYSTPLFLNRTIFPYTETLVSIENNLDWAQKVRQQVGFDARLQMSDTLAYELTDFDLILIDNDTVPNKIKTIHEVAQSYRLFAVIHDSECSEYQEALKDFGGWEDFGEYNPHTGVAIRGVSMQWDSIHRKISEHSNFSPSDVLGWGAAFLGAKNL